MTGYCLGYLLGLQLDWILFRVPTGFTAGFVIYGLTELDHVIFLL